MLSTFFYNCRILYYKNGAWERPVSYCVKEPFIKGISQRKKAFEYILTFYNILLRIRIRIRIPKTDLDSEGR